MKELLIGRRAQAVAGEEWKNRLRGARYWRDGLLFGAGALAALGVLFFCHALVSSIAARFDPSSADALPLCPGDGDLGAAVAAGADEEESKGQEEEEKSRRHEEEEEEGRERGEEDLDAGVLRHGSGSRDERAAGDEAAGTRGRGGGVRAVGARREVPKHLSDPENPWHASSDLTSGERAHPRAPPSPRPAPRPRPRPPPAPAPPPPAAEEEATGEQGYAYVQLAYDPPGQPPSHLWRALAMARALHRLSRYPLVLLTNSTDGAPGGVEGFSSRLALLNVRLLPVYEVPLPDSVPEPLRVHLWLLQIWRLTEYSKLIWLDTDSILVRNMDFLFDRDGVWAMRDNPTCTEVPPGQGSASSGIMLISPSKQTYEDIQAYLASLDWLEQTVGTLIQGFFEHSQVPLRLLDSSEATFGLCLGTTPSSPYGAGGPWSMSAFVHKSSPANECFYFDREAQLADANGGRANLCHYHPLGPWWRNLFCGAATITQSGSPQISDFCNDAVWYRGESASASRAPPRD